MSKKIWDSVPHTIAQALIHYLQQELRQRRGRRSFFRLDGFDRTTYFSFLHLLKAHKAAGSIKLANIPIEVRTTGTIRMHEEFMLEPDKSATWYRNNVANDHALLLIFNQSTSDAQSLKDIHPLTESFLASGEQPHLIKASFAHSLSPSEGKELQRFLQRYRQEVMQPQLRNLVAFFLACDFYLINNSGTKVSKAIGYALPYLGLFRSHRLEKELPRLDRLDRFLKDNYRAALLGGSSLEEKNTRKHQKMLEQASLDDERATGGLSATAKYTLLQTFIHEVVDNAQLVHKTLCLDWQEVAPVLNHNQRRNTRQSQQNLARDIEQALEAEAIDSQLFTTEAQAALQSLNQGQKIDNMAVDALLAEVDNLLPNSMTSKLRKLKTIKKRKSDDFLLLLMQSLSDLAENADHSTDSYNQTEAGEKTGEKTGELEIKLRWQVNKKQQSRSGNWNTPYQEAIDIFQSLYGGIEKHMPSIDWQLEPLWQEVRPKEATTKNELKAKRNAELVFLLQLGDASNQAELTWLYHPKGQAAASYGHIQSQAEAVIPIYDNVASHLSSAIDLATPLESLGVWYRTRRDMITEIRAIFADRISPELSWWQNFEIHVQQLAEQWRNFLQRAQRGGLFSADIAAFLAAYYQLLHYSNQHIQAEQDINQLYRWLSKMWLISQPNFGNWAVMPLLHPLKLHWLLQRAHAFEDYAYTIRTGDFKVVNNERFRQELVSMYSSTASPSVITLLSHNAAKPQYFSAVLEQGGYELYRAETEAELAYGMHSELSAADDVNHASHEAAQVLAKIIRDYIETYPFSHAGLDIYLLQCRNGALVGKLLSSLDKCLQKSDWLPHISLTIHSENQQVQLYEYLQRWLHQHSDYSKKEANAFFPRVTLRLLHCPLEQVSKNLSREDMVILADVLAEKGSHIRASVSSAGDKPAPYQAVAAQQRQNPQKNPQKNSQKNSQRQRYRTWPAPYSQEAITRQLALSLPQEGQPLAEFYRSQAIAKQNHSQEHYVDFIAESSLRPWESLLLDLHTCFNWVVCYDTVVDRFLLESVVPHAAEVIRYAVGLGPHRQHNLTVSASKQAKITVEKRLATRLEDIFPNSPHTYRQSIAQQLVTHAKDISGDLVLRAAGPGAFLNELIGIVASRHCLGLARATPASPLNQTKKTSPQELCSWIYLDNFIHWFAGAKYPDLLHCILAWEEETLYVDITVLEAKCLDENSVVAERKDAVKQVEQGLRRLAEIWSPEHNHADKPYWLNQLYQALAVNSSLTRAQLTLWQKLKQDLQHGNFQLRLQGYVYIFSYGGDAGVTAGQQVETSHLTTLAGQRLELHSYNRQGLRQVLQDLLEPVAEIALPSSSDISLMQEKFAKLAEAKIESQVETAQPVGTLNAASEATQKAATPTTGAAKEAVAIGRDSRQRVRKAETPEPKPAPRKTSQARASQSQAKASKPRQARAKPSQPKALQGSQSPTHQPKPSPSQPKQASKPATPDNIKIDNPAEEDNTWVAEQAAKLEQALRDYGISLYPIKPELADIGPNVVRYKIQLRAGEQLSKVQKVADDLVHRLALKSTPLIDNVLGTRYVGVDLPSQSRKIIELLPLLQALPKPEVGELKIVIGQAPDGKTVIEDLATFPHLLVAGSTNSGKSVFLRAVILSLLQQYRPEELKLLIIDPKRTDFSFFNGVKHLLTDSVVTDAEEARDHLLQLVQKEMPERQNIMQGRSMRIKDFNLRFPEEALPPIVAVIDEYAQLLSIMGRKEQQAFEKDLMELAAVARSTGIHLILATQRPDAKIVTGTLKANLTTRIAFKVASNTDSRIILDQAGAENLLGRGDLLFATDGGGIVRLQAPFIDEVKLQEVLEAFKE